MVFPYLAPNFPACLTFFVLPIIRLENLLIIMRKLLIDTNTALEFEKYKLFWNLEKLAITDTCLKELKNLAKKDKRAKIAYVILKQKAEIIKTEEKSGDSSILKAAKEKKYPVFTFDKKLVEKLRENNLYVINNEKEVFEFLKS